MSWEAWVALITIALILYGLARSLAGPDVILMGGAALFMTLSAVSDRFLSPREMAAVFGNEGLLAVGALFVVAAGLTETGGITLITERLLGRPRSVADAQIRMMLPVTGISAFLNNTPVVAMFVPVINDWTKKIGISPSKLFIPLSYAAVLGGVCTLIGTSTNLVVHGLMLDARKTDPTMPVMGMFTIGAVGVPVAVVGLVYILLVSRRLLPDRKPFRANVADPRQYTVEMLVRPGSAIDGQTIEAAGLRRLSSMYLSAVERDGEPIVAVGPEQVLRGNDHLVFVGVIDSVVELQKVRGLLPATDQIFKVTTSQLNRSLIEAVVSETSPMVGKSIREGRFRTRYDAAVIAVYRNGERIDRKIGDIVLKPGDTLLLQAHPRFFERHRNNRDFLLLSPVADFRSPRHHRAWMAIAILVAMVALVGAERYTGISVFNGALVAAGLMGVTGCLSAERARKSIDLSVLAAIAAALAIGQTMERTGLAGFVADRMLAAVDSLGPWAVLAGIYLLTLGFTELVTNNAAAALVFPIARAAAAALGVSFMPFAIVVAVAASSGFATPLGYQTHLMVYGPGGYRFSDFVTIGAPLDLLVMAIAVTLTPLFFPF